ncbi:protein O-linked-mannose beta-1,4-N-acetylglucosaminyltransferase 2-like [Centruroides sculpturatus]|uniref:protein O-linked-mannose beta-1,4-N-acetylglucosaminyltransferase 2-like n=1 Tax=Centruroides sculpturatus TaxID=218467 RepID=UPI000C6E9A34|nr:protein O-linked-mannose beta-1,4-N-acetylglucosaminyltransferase 2-like [Centruroides sculpturatus]
MEFVKASNCLVILIIAYLLYDNWTLKQIIRERKQNISEDGIYSSVWCRGSNNTNRKCRFKNLCYWPRSKEYIFFHHEKSILSGVPNNRFPVLVDLSSVDDHNTQYFTFVDLPHSVSNDFKIEFINKSTLIFNRFNPDNLMHVFHDDLLPVYATLNEICHKIDDCKVQLFFSENRGPGPYYELYKIFNVAPLIRELKLETLYCFKNAWLGLNKMTTWYDYGFKVPQGPLMDKDWTMMSRIIKQFCEYFIKSFNLSNWKSNKEQTAVLIVREQSRLILNEYEVIETIKETTGLSVLVVGLEKYSVPEIVNIIRHCVLVIGMHGALLVLSMFLPPGSILIELFPYAVNSTHYTPYKTLVSLPGMNIIYQSWQNMELKNTVTHPDNPVHLGGINHLSPEQKQAILFNKEVPQHLCCYNPEWMFRIYQDTIVNVSSLKYTLKSAWDNRNYDLEKILVKNSENIVKLFYPGQVRHSRCNIVSTVDNKNAIKITWEPPWNLQYIPYALVQYEVWILLNDTENVTAVIMKETNYIFENIIDNREYLIWIRCHADSQVGPFNTYPISCNT